MTRALLCASCLLAGVPGFPIAFALAQESSAAPGARSRVDELLAGGIRSRELGRDAEALELYRQASALEPENARVLAHLGATYHALGRWVLAHTYLSRALEHREDPYIERHRAELEEALATVGEHIGFLEVYGAPAGAEALINGQLVATLPMTAPIPVIVGSYLLEVRFKGHYTLGRPINVAQRVLTREEVELSPHRAGGGAPPRAAERPAPPSAALQPSDDLGGGSGGARWLPWTLGGLSVAATATSLWAWQRREHHAARWNDDGACLGVGITREERCGAERERGQRAETIVWVSGVAAGVFAAGAIVSALAASDDEAPEPMTFRCAPGLGGASCSGSF